MRYLLLAFLCLALPGRAFPAAMVLSLEQALKEGSFIGRVKVLECGPLSGKQPDNSPSEKQEGDVGRYSKWAKAEVIEAARGAKPGDIVLIEYDTGLTCPNIIYSPGDDRLIVAGKQKDGHLATLNTHAGSWDVQNGKITDFHLFATHKPELAKDSTPARILAEFRILLAAKSKPKSP